MVHIKQVYAKITCIYESRPIINLLSTHTLLQNVTQRRLKLQMHKLIEQIGYPVASIVGQQKQQQQQGGVRRLNPVFFTFSRSFCAPPLYRMIRELKWTRHTAR